MRRKREDEHTMVSIYFCISVCCHFSVVTETSSRNQDLFLISSLTCTEIKIHLQRPIPSLMETKVSPPPKFDLAASNFPPLPGSVVSPRGETTPEMRLSDVVRGLKVPNKVRLSFSVCSTLKNR